MPMISFTQFVRPDGARDQVEFDRPDDIAQKAATIVADGCELQIEVLQTGYVSATIFDPDADDGAGDDIGIEIAPNEDQREENQTIAGDAAMMAIDNLIRNYKPKQPADGFDGDADQEEFKPE